ERAHDDRAVAALSGALLVAPAVLDVDAQLVVLERTVHREAAAALVPAAVGSADERLAGSDANIRHGELAEAADTRKAANSSASKRHAAWVGHERRLICSHLPFTIVNQRAFHKLRGTHRLVVHQEDGARKGRRRGRRRRAPDEAGPLGCEKAAPS